MDMTTKGPLGQDELEVLVLFIKKEFVKRLHRSGCDLIDLENY